MEGIIYKYVSPSGKVYIGQTINEKHRRRVFNTLNCTYGGVKIDAARKKYGPENFKYDVLMKVIGDDPDEIKSYLNTLEVGFIRMYDSFNSGYNSTEGGDSIFHITEEIRDKMRNSHLGKKLPEELKQKLIESRKGKKLSEEHRKKISESRKGMKFSPEHCKHIGDSKNGMIHSDDTKRKMSESHKGKLSHPITEEMRLKLSKSMTGRVDSEETKKKKSESAKKGWAKRKTHK